MNFINLLNVNFSKIKLKMDNSEMGRLSALENILKCFYKTAWKEYYLLNFVGYIISVSMKFFIDFYSHGSRYSFTEYRYSLRLRALQRKCNTSAKRVTPV